MACTICCEILKIHNMGDAPVDIQTLSMGSTECPKCYCDYCKMHAIMIKVGQKIWKNGCPACSGNAYQHNEFALPHLDGKIPREDKKAWTELTEDDLRADFELWTYSLRY